MDYDRVDESEESIPEINTDVDVGQEVVEEEIQSPE